MMQKDPGRLVLPIQYLRGFAALMVVYHHTKTQIPMLEPYLPGQFGALGVDIFFVISGFIIFITARETQPTPLDFFVRRVIRIVPLYWLLTLLMCAIWWVAPSLFKTLIVTPVSLIQSLLFVPHYSLSFPEHVFPLLVPGWTLNYEMFFYLIFALLLPLPMRVMVGLVVLILGALVIMGSVLGPFDSAAAVTYTNLMLLEFAAGVGLGYWWVHRRGIGMPASVGLTLFACGWFLLAFNSVHPTAKLVDVVAATLIVAGSLNHRFLSWNNRALKQVGDATYAIYLSHIFVLGVVRLIWVRVVDVEPSVFHAMVFACVAMLACTVAGLLVHRWLERPITQSLNDWYRSRSVRRRPAGQIQ